MTTSWTLLQNRAVFQQRLSYCTIADLDLTARQAIPCKSSSLASDLPQIAGVSVLSRNECLPIANCHRLALKPRDPPGAGRALWGALRPGIGQPQVCFIRTQELATGPRDAA